MKRTLALLGLSGLLTMTGPSAGQQAGGLGAPIVDSKLEASSIVVRVVNGVMSRPMSSLGVSLVSEASGKEFVVRTGPDGRAPFRGLTKGGTYTAFIKVGDKEVASQPLIVPEAGGVRVLLSPVPLRQSPGGGEAPTGAGPHGGAGGPTGMPDPRNMSGLARPEKNDTPGTLTVRTIQGKFRIDEIAGRVADHPKDAVVHLVSYGVGDKIEVVSKKVDEQGRVVFPRLRTDNSASYYALAAFERGGKYDRLQTSSIELPPQVGLRLMLAGLAPDSSAAALDDIPAIKSGEKAPPIGDAVIELAGQTSRIGEVELVEITEMKVVATAKPALESVAGPAQVAVGTPSAEGTLKDGLVQVRVEGPSGALAGAKVSVMTTPSGADGAELTAQTTDATGEVSFDGLRPGLDVTIVVAARGASAASTSFKVPATGGMRVGSRAMWKNRPPVTLARFSNVAPGLYVARAKDAEGKYWTPPFMMVPDRGAIAQMFVYPSLLFKFQGGAELDDAKLWFPISVAIWNPSMMPLDGGDGGLLIPLPKGFVGAAISDEMSTRVRVDGDHGFVWKGAFPSGQRQFRASFALPVDDGNVDFEMPLPFGSFDSHLAFEDFPGMQLNVPTNAVREPMKMPGGKDFIVLKKINIKPGQSLVLSVRGLPEKPAWKKWVPLITGLGVLGLLIWGFASILIVRSQGAKSESLEDKREALLSRLVVVDDKLAKAGGGKKGAAKKLRVERAKLVSELELVYEELDAR